MGDRPRQSSQAKQFIRTAASLMEQLRLKCLMGLVSEDDIQRLGLAYANLQVPPAEAEIPTEDTFADLRRRLDTLEGRVLALEPKLDDT